MCRNFVPGQIQVLAGGIGSGAYAMQGVLSQNYVFCFGLRTMEGAWASEGPEAEVALASQQIPTDHT